MTGSDQSARVPKVFVVGCPRSGTSPFARWLAASGFRTATDSRRKARYPAGYYEHMPILMFHKALERLPRGADHAIRLDPFLTSDLLEDEFVRVLFEFAFRTVREGAVDFVKFPQLALSCDFLLEQFPGAHIVGIWRDPRPTFRSLVSREFPLEMVPSSGIKAVLLWNLYAYHLTGAAYRHPAQVTILSIDHFIEGKINPAKLLARIGYSHLEPAAIDSAVDRNLWFRSVPLRWRLYHGAMREVCRRLSGRIGAERTTLLDEVAWLRRLESISRRDQDPQAEERKQ